MVKLSQRDIDIMKELHRLMNAVSKGTATQKNVDDFHKAILKSDVYRIPYTRAAWEMMDSGEMQKMRGDK